MTKDLIAFLALNKDLQFYTKDKRCENIHNYQLFAVVLLGD